MREILIAIVLIIFPAMGLKAAQLEIPKAIQAPDGYQVVTLHAQGNQIFLCTAEQGMYKWQWQAPDALLYDQNNHVVGKHGAGPSWHHRDGSWVIGKVVQKIESPKKDAASWLLLKATKHSGQGVLAKASYIQRINTQGGLTPVDACNSNHLGLEKSVPYSADYMFYYQ